MHPENDLSFDRPLECSECQKPIVVHYTEIVGGCQTRWAHCVDCPVLAKHLHGGQTPEQVSHAASAGLVCGECGTDWNDMRMTRRVGCPHCYEVFGDYISSTIIASHALSPTLSSLRKSAPFHIGRAPGETEEMSPTLKLVALNKALEETLKKEDYEQAAWLRDQINELTKRGKEGESAL